MPVTPFRRTVLTFDIDEVTLGRQSWTLQRKGEHIRPAKRAGTERTHDVFCPGGDAWILRPQFAEAAQALKSGVGGYVEEADVDLAPGMVSFPTFRARTDLPQIGAGASVIASGAPAFKPRRAAGDDWDLLQLSADVASLPQPTPDTETIYPQDRILSGLVTYEPNTPFWIHLFTPEDFAGTDAFFTFYFGGETECLPESTSGGQFCVVLRGGGEAELQEWDEVEGEWVERQSFRWNEPGAGDGAKSKGLAVIPYASRRIWLAGGMATPYSSGGFSLLGLLASVVNTAINPEPSPGNKTLYRESFLNNSHIHTTYTTGEGTIRVDLRRDLNGMHFSILRGVYPEEGVLIDSPFEINRDLPDETPIRVLLYGYQYPNTDVVCQLYNAATGVALSVDGDGNFLSVLGQRKYYATFTLTSDDGIGTPVFYGYIVDIEGAFASRSGAGLQSVCSGVQITGPDLEPTQDAANVFIQDPTNALELLRLRDGMRTRISVYSTVTGLPVSHLFEGETNQVKAQLRGTPGDTYPSKDWYDYQVRLSGLYPRLFEQFHDTPPFSFVDSSNGPTAGIQVNSLTDTGYDPWKVTDVIRWLLNHAGFHNDELDIPDLSLRLWPTAGSSADTYAIQPGAEYGAMAVDLIANILGAAFIRDPNAGTRGMWRVLLPPSLLSANYLHRFSLDAPPNPGRLVHYPGAYGINTSFVRANSYHSSVSRPVGNVVTVYGISDDGGSATGPELLTAQLINYNSIANPLSPDYLGRAVPLTRGADTFLATQEACNWVAAEIYRKYARAEKWFEWCAPLVLVRDLLDPWQNVNLLRPLRVNDLVYLRRDGVDVPVILRSVNPDWRDTDERQMASYEGKAFL